MSLKIFLWLVTLAFALLCLTCWLISHLVVQYLWDFRSAFAVPWFPHFFLIPHTWLLFCPLPWMVVATVLSFRGDLSPASAFVFAGSICFAATAVLCIVALASLIAVLPFKL
jgi:hypothetical protein